MRKTAKSPIAVVRAALKAAEVLPLYSHRFSPRKFTQRQLFAILVLKAFLKLDYRGVIEVIRDWPRMQKTLGLKSIPTHNALWYANQRLLKNAGTHALLDATMELGKPAGEQSSIDSTGLESSHQSRYYVKRRGKDLEYRTYPKMSVVVDNKTHLLLSAVADEGPKPDQVEFRQAVTEAYERAPFRELLADAAYDSEANHRFLREELGVGSVIPARYPHTNTDPQQRPRTPYRRKMREEFPKERYGQRWQVESAISQFKRRLGSSLSARSASARAGQIMLMVLTFNLMLILFCPHSSQATAIQNNAF